MIYVFEDNREDVISKLFRHLYPDEIQQKIIYTNGNGNLESVCRETLDNNSEEHICAFIDYVAENSQLGDMYDLLRKLSKKYEYRLIVLPIPCVEYYLALSLLGHNIIH